MNSYVSFGVYDHGEGRKVPELGDVLYVTRTAALVLNHLEGRGRSGVIDAQGVRDLGIGRGDCEITSNEQIAHGDVSKVVESRRCSEVS